MDLDLQTCDFCHHRFSRIKDFVVVVNGRLYHRDCAAAAMEDY